MSWWDIHRHKVEWAGVLAFLAAFWTAFSACCLWVLQ